jgi:hypothetical protein
LQLFTSSELVARFEQNVKDGFDIDSMQTLRLPLSLAAYRIGKNNVYVHAIGTGSSYLC